MAKKKKRPKAFVLDTSVILYDADALHSFQEHDVAVPITVLEELDQFKKGNAVINLHAREFMRHLDRLSERHDLRQWIPLDGNGGGRFRVIHANGHGDVADATFGTRKNDHRILDAALELSQQETDRPVILVSKDINLRVKARALSLLAEDYETVQVHGDLARLSGGHSEVSLDDELVEQLYNESWLAIEEIAPTPPPCHHFFILRGPRKSALATFSPATGRIERIAKPTAYGISPRNAEQTFALHAILDPSIRLVSITGAAGTGKTLLALAGALDQRRLYRQIYVSRPIVPLSNKDIGYLPGDIKSKIDPYMQPLWDNLGVIRNQFEEESKEYRKIAELLELEKLHIMPLTYIRGRSFGNVFLIVDEAQNLTPHEIKTIITRAGEDTKIVFTGDIFQIDTPYLDTRSNGLAYLIDRIRSHPLHAHVNLEKGERSELANLASSLL